MFKKMKLGRKISGAFLVILIFTAYLSYVGISGLRHMAHKADLSDDSARMTIMMLEARQQEKNLIIRGDKKHAAAVTEKIAEFKKTAAEHKGKLKDQADLKELEAVMDSLGRYEAAFAQLVDITGKKKTGEYGKLLAGLDAKLAETGQAVQKALKESFAKDEQEMASAVTWRNSLMAGSAALAIVFGLLIPFFLSRSITLPINKAVAGLSDGASQVSQASSQVSQASQSLAEGASEQAAGIEETSSSIEEMSSMTRQNADNANQANVLMGETTKVVDEANRSMGELTESMREISAASEETAKIIKTIDEIAFQTNLLALNAAVEAARAGEAGAGFAVVADEVRNLAMRAAEAARSTADLIEGTVKKIKVGSDTVARTNEAFAKVASGAKKVGELVGEIAAASSEQAQGIDQISRAITEMDRVVQKNAASAEESASASEEMNAQAETMKGFVAELSGLVGGQGGKNGASAGAIHESPRQRQATQKPGGNGNGKRHPQAKGANGNGKRLAPPLKKGPAPEEIIPLAEGSFKEF